MVGQRIEASATRAGLDARAANIVMRVVRNVADTGRTIVCTIHQPAIDIFEVPCLCLCSSLLPQKSWSAPGYILQSMLAVEAR